MSTACAVLPPVDFNQRGILLETQKPIAAHTASSARMVGALRKR